MIEVIYREDVSEESIHEPRNVKQIGTIDPKYRIYIEESVLECIRRKPSSEEAARYGLLLGELKRASGTTWLFIRGMAEALSSEIIFDGTVWSGFYEDIDRYFPNTEILGWFASLPFLNAAEFETCREIQYTHFSGADKVFFLYDRAEDEEKFYRPDGAMLKEVTGYFSFPEKNDSMIAYQQDKQPDSMDGESAPRMRQGTIGEAPHKWNLSAASVLVTAALLAAVILMNQISSLSSGEKKESTGESAGEVVSALEAAAADGTVREQTTEQEGREEEGSTAEDGSGLKSDSETGAESGTGEKDTANTEETKETETGAAASQKTDEAQTAAEEEGGGQEDQTVPAGSGTLARYYTVKKGETLYSICMDVYQTAAMVEIVREINGIGEDYMISEGQKIVLP